MSKPLLIIDLDETLIHSEVERSSFAVDFEVGHFQVSIRPHVQVFLQRAAVNWRLAIWTAASPRYARQVLAQILPGGVELEFVWSRDQCSLNFQSTGSYYKKDLNLVYSMGYSPNQTLAIDDRPEVYSHERSVMGVEPFGGQPDDELLFILQQINRRHQQLDVRTPPPLNTGLHTEKPSPVWMKNKESFRWSGRRV